MSQMLIIAEGFVLVQCELASRSLLSPIWNYHLTVKPTMAVVLGLKTQNKWAAVVGCKPSVTHYPVTTYYVEVSFGSGRAN